MWLLVVAAVVLLLVWWLTRGMSPRGGLDDGCALDQAKRPRGRARGEQAPAEPPPAPEDLVDPAIGPLVRGLRSDVPAAAAEAAEALGASGRPGAAAPLIQALGRDSRPVQFAAAEALLALGPAAAPAVREGREKEGDPALRTLLGVIHEQLQLKERGQPTLPARDILAMSPGLVDEITRELER